MKKNARSKGKKIGRRKVSRRGWLEGGEASEKIALRKKEDVSSPTSQYFPDIGYEIKINVPS